jgi:hypothetical protein
MLSWFSVLPCERGSGTILQLSYGNSLPHNFQFAIKKIMEYSTLHCLHIRNCSLTKPKNSNHSFRSIFCFSVAIFLMPDPSQMLVKYLREQQRPSVCWHCDLHSKNWGEVYVAVMLLLLAFCRLGKELTHQITVWRHLISEWNWLHNVERERVQFSFVCSLLRLWSRQDCSQDSSAQDGGLVIVSCAKALSWDFFRRRKCQIQATVNKNVIYFYSL